jgi:predicted metal-dependent HD superfamily phosphohydrolase
MAVSSVIPEFGNVDDAVRAYAAAERDYDSDDRVEVVLIGSDSLDTVAETPPNVFGASSPMDRLLRAV